MPGSNASKTSTADKSASSRERSVLLVDDDKAVLHSLSLLLEDLGFRVTTAGNGIEALRKFRASPADLVLTDIIMPDKEGIALIMELRRDYPGAKIIAMSGGGRIGNKDFVSIATALGADAGLQKPFDDILLAATLGAVLDRKTAASPRASAA